MMALVLTTGGAPLRASESGALPGVLEGLRADAIAKDKKIREAAIRRAREIGREAIPVLEQVFLFDGSDTHYAMMRDERMLALQCLAQIGGREAIPTLIIAAGDKEKTVRTEAQRQLLQTHGLTLEDLRRRWLLSEDWFLRQGALITLHDHGVTADELAREISAVVADPASEQRLAAVQAIGQLESREGLACLRRLITDETAGLPLRLEALGAMHHLDGREVPLEAWTLALGEAGMRNLYLATLSGVHIAMRYLEAAGEKAVPVLRTALASPEPVVRLRAAWVLGRIGPVATAAAPALRRAAQDPDRAVADEARRALARVTPDEPRLALSVPAAPVAAPPVRFEDRGATLWLDNGLVSCEVDKANGSLVSLRRAGDARNIFGARGSWYATHPWWLAGRAAPRPFVSAARVVRQNDDLVEVAVTLRCEEPRPLTQEQHYVVRRGVSGVYQFAAYRKPREAPPVEAVFDYARFMKADASLFRRAAVSDSLQGELYSPEKIAELKRRRRELSNATYRQADGRVWAKYSWCPYEQESQVHGATGDGLGLWVIIPNDESGYNLPSNHPGGVHDEGDGGASIVIITHQEAVPHNIGSEQKASVGPEPWEKLYGPLLLYVNTGASHAAMWADAKRREEIETAAHPAAWLQHELYPLARGAVRGRVLAADGRPAAGAWVILCHPHPNPERAWQRHKGPYIYRAFAEADGTFEITGARSGTYSLLARVDGVLGVARLDGVTVKEGERSDAGTLTIKEERAGRLLWELGSPDGTPREFPGAVDSHEWCGWLNNYGRLFPNDVDFTVGRSDPARDWYYCQPGGWPAGYGDRCRPTEWRIHFDLPTVPANGAVLTVCIAATRGGKLAVQCNETRLPARQLNESDMSSSVCMAPDRGAYYGFRTERFDLAPAGLHPGRNTLRFRFGTGNYPFEAIMYDTIKLEAVER